MLCSVWCVFGVYCSVPVSVVWYVCCGVMCLVCVMVVLVMWLLAWRSLGLSFEVWCVCVAFACRVVAFRASSTLRFVLICCVCVVVVCCCIMLGL